MQSSPRNQNSVAAKSATTTARPQTGNASNGSSGRGKEAPVSFTKK